MVGFARGQALGQCGVGLGLGQVHAHITEQGSEAGELFGVGALVPFDLLKA